MTIPGNSRTSGLSEARASGHRRLSKTAFFLYFLLAAADMTAHLGQDARAGRDWRQPANLAIAFSASLFWPVDLLAGVLLDR